MAAPERQRDKQVGISPEAVVADRGARGRRAAEPGRQPRPGPAGRLGRIVAAVPPAAFLVAVSMIERRAARRPRPIAGGDGAVGEPSAPGRPSPVQEAGDAAQDAGDEALLTAARRAGAPGPQRGDCRRGVPAREYCPADAPWRGRRLDRHREDVATYGTGSPATGPAGSWPVPARPSAAGPPAAGAEGRRPGSRTGFGDGQRNWQTV